MDFIITLFLPCIFLEAPLDASLSFSYEPNCCSSPCDMFRPPGAQTLDHDHGGDDVSSKPPLLPRGSSLEVIPQGILTSDGGSKMSLQLPLLGFTKVLARRHLLLAFPVARMSPGVCLSRLSRWQREGVGLILPANLPKGRSVMASKNVCMEGGGVSDS